MAAARAWVLNAKDADLVKPLHQRIKKWYDNIYLKTKVTRIEAGTEGLEVFFEGEGAPASEVFDKVLVAVGQENAFPWIERDLGIEFDKWEVPKVDAVTHESTRPGVFFGGDAAFGPKNIIWSVEHGHQAAISIHQHCMDKPVAERLPPGVNLQSRKMGMHEWSYNNDYSGIERRLVPHVSLKERFKKIDIEVENQVDLGANAVVEITRLRNPCSQIENIQAGLLSVVLGRAPDGSLIRRAGVMAIVLEGGLVHPGDKIEVVHEPSEYKALVPV